MSIGTQQILNNYFNRGLQKQAASKAALRATINAISNAVGAGAKGHEALRGSGILAKALLHDSKMGGRAVLKALQEGVGNADYGIKQAGWKTADLINRLGNRAYDAGIELGGSSSKLKALLGKTLEGTGAGLFNAGSFIQTHPRSVVGGLAGLGAAGTAAALYGDKATKAAKEGYESAVAGGKDLISRIDGSKAAEEAAAQQAILEEAARQAQMNSMIGGGAGAIAGGVGLGALARVLAPEKYKRLATALGALTGAGLGGAAGYMYGGDAVGKVRDRIG